MKAKTLGVKIEISDHVQEEKINKATDNDPHRLLCQLLEKWKRC